jgi:hypothetical protein
MKVSDLMTQQVTTIPDVVIRQRILDEMTSASRGDRATPSTSSCARAASTFGVRCSRSANVRHYTWFAKT